MLVSILAFSHPYILRLMCACLHPCILTSSYTQIPVYLVVSSRPHNLMLYSQISVCLLLSSHPHTLRFIRTCWYPCILISSDSCVFPFILASSHPHFFFIYNTDLHFVNKYLHKYTSKKNHTIYNTTKE